MTTPNADSWSVPGVEPTLRGKVRDLYDLGDQLLLVATDRVSAFDVILPEAIPDKGAILTSLTRVWFELLGEGVRHHLISTDANDLPQPYRTAAAQWGPRFMIVEKLEMLPIECVVRGYLAGSGWKEYLATGSVCGIALGKGLRESAELAEPLFTPSTKASSGHDENITWQHAERLIGSELLEEVAARSQEIYQFGRAYARERGILLADTKFEFGRRPNGEVVLADEVLTPDSSRYWPADEYQEGGSPPSFDKQFVRNYLEQTSWDKSPPAPPLPQEIVEGTRQRYLELWQRLTGKAWVSQ